MASASFLTYFTDLWITLYNLKRGSIIAYSWFLKQRLRGPDVRLSSHFIFPCCDSVRFDLEIRPLIMFKELEVKKKTKLKVFERKVRRRIYWPTKQKDGTWWIKTNEELNRLTDNKNIINYIKAQRLAWFGHVQRMPDTSMVKTSIWVFTRTNKIARRKT